MGIWLRRMRRKSIVLLAILSVGLPVAGQAQQTAGPGARSSLASITGRADPNQAPTGELFDSYILVEAQGAGFRDPSRIARMAEELSRLPFGNVLIQVRTHGEAYYNSALAPKALGVSKDFDPLAEFLKLLKQGENPKKVYAWLDLFKVGNINRAVPLPPEHVTLLHPDWLSRNSKFEAVDSDGNVYLEPGHPEVRAYLARVAAEVVANYAIDGVVLDGLRYPGLSADWGYNPVTLDAWRKAVGSKDLPQPQDEEFSSIRGVSVNWSVRDIYQRVKQVRKDAEVLVFVMADGPPPRTAQQFRMASRVFHGALQNWPWWLTRGFADRVLLRNYRIEGIGTTTFDGWNAFAGRLVQKHGVEIIPVIAGHDNISVDVVSQIRRVQQAGLAGVALSHFSEPIRDRSSRGLFFRALSKRVLSPESERLSFPKVGREVASALGDKPDIPPPPKIEGESSSKPGAGQADGPKEKKAPRGFDDLRPEKNRFISPSLQAVRFLKRKFPNIF